MNKENILIVMPAYNVAHVLRKTISELPKDCAGEIILVDDGSTDDTAKVGTALGLTVVTHSKNRGYGGAQKTGYRIAMEKNAKAVVLVHGDNQYDPSLVEEFSKKIIEEGYEIVTGTRMILGDVLRKGMPLWKLIFNRLLTGLENFVFQTNISDYHNGYRAYSVDFLRRVPLNLLSDKFDFDTDIILQGAIRKSRIAEIPHPTRYEEENSQMPFSKGVIYGWGILKTVFRYLLHKTGVYKQKLFMIK